VNAPFSDAPEASCLWFGRSLRRCAFLLFCGVACALGQAPDEIAPSTSRAPAESLGVNWKGVLTQSLGFLTIEHGFRYATEPATRNTGVPFFSGYVDALHNLHGWSDGDPFYVNYVGHPIQGATAAYIFTQNDRAYRNVEFGKNRAYWKSRLRATAFSWAYSEQFEIGPLSEATIGNTQAFYPQQGFVDQVATPAIGLVWMLGEDSIDKYIIRRLEQHTKSPNVRRITRAALNPSRSLANMLAGRYPWYRDSRPYVQIDRDADVLPGPQTLERGTHPEEAAFEFMATTRVTGALERTSRGVCIGGGGTIAFHLSPHWGLVGDVDGCKLTGFGPNISGDSLTYMGGPRWTPRPASRWQPFAQFLIGGRKMTHERVVGPPLVVQPGSNGPYPDRRPNVQFDEISGLTVAGGGGVDLKLTSALGLRLAQLDYMHSWHSRLSGVSYTDNLRFTAGLVVRFGTW